MTTNLILGTAGHIDHGKTSLIRALTGVDTDRLPEEKRRGITIELGFAELAIDEFRFGIVDVPGHERFIRNMLCGATGMDLAMLVVAADDSAKQQTREHLDILRLLHLKMGVIVLTKIDLVDRDWLELVTEEIRQLTAGTFLEKAPIVRTSSLTGEGLDELRRELVRAGRVVAPEANLGTDTGPFRMAIDRVFTIAGHGTILTGSVGSGACHVGDELAIEPGGIRVRVRSLQNHDRSVEEIHRGQRAAINVVGIHHDEVTRGQELCTPGHLRPAKLLTVKLDVLASSPRPLKNRTRVKFHLGTAEVTAAVRLLETDVLEPGQSGFAQLFLAEPVVAVWNQPYVVRFESPAATIGGGTILDPDAERIRRADDETRNMLRQLSSNDLAARASAALYFAGWRPWQPDDLSRTAGIGSPEPIVQQLAASGTLVEIQCSPTRRLRIHQAFLNRLAGRISGALRKLHEMNPLRLAHERAAVLARLGFLDEPAIFDMAIARMRSQGIIQSGPRGIALTGHGPKLSANEQRLMTQLVETIRSAGMQPPSVKELQQQAPKLQSSVPQLLALAAANGELVEISSDFYLYAEVDKAARETLQMALAGSEGRTVSELRELLNTSRKYAVPYCEYLDRSGFTRRRGDVRVLATSEVASGAIND